MSGRRKISPPVRSTQVTCGFSRTKREHFVGRQLVGRLALPDVAGLAAVLAPVREAEIQLQRRGGPDGRRLEQRSAEVRRSSERVGEPRSRPIADVAAPCATSCL